MLTATYSIVTISTEQNNTRRILHRLQQHIRNAWNGLKQIDLASVESAFNNLTQFDKYCRNRKVEVHLIPAIRRVTNDADSLLAELEALSASGMNILRALREQLCRACQEGIIRVNEVCSSMELYCTKLQKRLAKEEDELFPLARRLFSIEEWFAIAEKFLADDAGARGRNEHFGTSTLLPSVPAPMPGLRMAAV
jgi:hemerythrin-like domain-containing protein